MLLSYHWNKHSGLSRPDTQAFTLSSNQIDKNPSIPEPEHFWDILQEEKYASGISEDRVEEMTH